jgi:ribosomal protein S18 acetylase RimI-like enzyme
VTTVVLDVRPALPVTWQAMADVRPMRPDDVSRVAALHAEYLPAGFFAKLGRRYLRAYYRTFIDSPYAVAFTATIGGDPVGMIVGTTHTREHYQWVAHQRAVRLALVGMTAMLARPRQLLLFIRTRVARYVRALRRATSPSVPASARTQPDVAVLTHIAVDAGVRFLGIGRTLVSAFLDELRAGNVEEVRLITAASDGAAAFYERLRWDRLMERPAADGSRAVEFRFRPLVPAAVAS